MLEEEDEIAEFLEKKWLPLSVELGVDGEVLLWTSMLRYSYCEIVVGN